jgi:hypothetical protein
MTIKDNLADVGKATQQVINTYNSLKGHLKGQYTAKAFICASKGSAPIEQKKYQQELSKAFPEKKNGVSSNYGIDSPDKFSDFLRGVSSIGKGKGKKKRG